MAREHARILCSIWRPGDDFRDRSPEAQRMYFLLLSQREMNNAGVLPLMLGKWARCSTGTTTEDVEKALQELVEHRYIVVDEETDEVLVRSFIRNDGVAKQPNVLRNALRVAQQIDSPIIRATLARELVRIGQIDAALDLDPNTPTGPPDSPPPTPDAEPPANPSGTLPETSEGTLPNKITTTSAGLGRGKGKGCSSRPEVVEGGDARELDPDNPRCDLHAHIPATERGPACRACGAVRRLIEHQATVGTRIHDHAERSRLDDLARVQAACALCDADGWVLGPDGLSAEPAARCDHRPALRAVPDHQESAS